MQHLKFELHDAAHCLHLLLLLLPSTTCYYFFFFFYYYYCYYVFDTFLSSPKPIRFQSEVRRVLFKHFI